MRACLALALLLVASSPAHAGGSIFADDFEAGRICWVWSGAVASDELCFEAPFEAPPPVAQQTVRADASVRRADLIIGMDTTGSMGGEITNLENSMVFLIGQLSELVPDLAFAVAGYDDYPFGDYGSAASGDLAFYLRHRAMTATTPAGVNSINSAVFSFATHNGLDLPESGWEMVRQVATGAGSGPPPYGVPAFDPATAPPLSLPPGEQIGTGGGVGLRDGSLPVLIWITDAPSHNSSVTGNPYGPIPDVTPATSAEALAAMTALGGRIVGVVSDAAGRPDVLHGVASTGARVLPAAWDPRPAGCAPNQCCTGVNGAGVAADVDGLCPLVFSITSFGTGLSTALQTAIELLIGFGAFDVDTTLADDPVDAVDAVAAFVERVVADDGAPLPCTQGLTAADLDPVDGFPDTFLDVEPGSQPCFQVVAKTNTTVAPTGVPQVFRADLEIVRDGALALDRRELYFQVPP